MKQHTLITKLLTSINISNKILLIYIALYWYTRQKHFFGKKHTHWHYLGFIKELDFREVPFTTLKLLHRVLLKH